MNHSLCRVRLATIFSTLIFGTVITAFVPPFLQSSSSSLPISGRKKRQVAESSTTLRALLPAKRNSGARDDESISTDADSKQIKSDNIKATSTHAPTMTVTASSTPSNVPVKAPSEIAKGDKSFVNFSSTGEIATFDGDEKAKATDFANYFCAYSQLYHQKQMLTDHNRMAAYHAAIVGNSEIFQDKVVMDVGTGSGILAVWAAQAGAKRVYAVEYTDMAKHAQSVVEANGVDHIVKVIQGAVEEVILPEEDWEEFGLCLEEGDDSDNYSTNNQDENGDTNMNEGENYSSSNGNSKRKNQRVVDIILSEWMGYFLLRESMLDSLVRARDMFLKPKSGIMLPSHATMLLAPIVDEEDRRAQHNEYAAAMADWQEFAETTQTMYGVDMSCLEAEFEREQKEYYVLSSRWAELGTGAILAEPCVVKTLDMAVCTLEDARGVGLMVGETKGLGASFDFDIVGRKIDGSAAGGNGSSGGSITGPISGFAGWFTVDFKSRTDELGRNVSPDVPNPAYLSTGPEMGYTHWGQQVFHLPSAIPLLGGQTTRINGTMEMMRTKESARLYNVRFRYTTSRRKSGRDKEAAVLMKGEPVELVYQIP